MICTALSSQLTIHGVICYDVRVKSPEAGASLQREASPLGLAGVKSPKFRAVIIRGCHKIMGMKKTLPAILSALVITAVSVCTAASGIAAEAPDPSTEGALSMTEDPSGTYEPQVEKGLLRISLTEPVGTMDVQKTTGDYLIPLNIYERLFDLQSEEDGSSQLVNGLAEDYSVSPDGLTYSFTLRGDAFFSDGTPVTSSDVAFTFTRMLALKESVQSDFADMIRGAEEVMSGQTDTLEGIHVIDDKHLDISLSEPFAGYIYQLATPSCSILSESFVTQAGNDFGSDAGLTLGSGPYRVTEFTDERITLEENPYYHCHEGEQLSVSKAQIFILPPALIDRSFRTGGLDLLDTTNVNPDTVEDVYKSDVWSDRLVVRNKVEIQYLMLNMDAYLLDDIRIRKAIGMAINRQKILDTLYGGDGILTDGIYPRGLIGFCEENQGWLTYDPEEARRLISEVPGAGEVRLELAANSQSNARKLTMLQMIRQDLSDVGLNVSIVNYDSDSQMFLRKEGRLMAYCGEWSADFNDPDNFIYTFFGSREKTKNRSSNYADSTVFRRITEARAIQDQEERLQEYADLEKLLVQDEAVWVPLFSTNHLFVLGDRTESFTPFWAGWSSMYFRDVVLKEGQ